MAFEQQPSYNNTIGRIDEMYLQFFIKNQNARPQRIAADGRSYREATAIL